MPRHRNHVRARWIARRFKAGGQSLVESCVVIMVVLLIFHGFLQAALLYNHERVLQFASFASARSATVGFNEDVYTRAYRAAAIPASGLMRTPGPNQSQPAQLGLETAIIPCYLNPENSAGILQYEYWDTYRMDPVITGGGATIQEYHHQEHPLQIWKDSGLLWAFYGRDTVTIANDVSMGLHYQHYLQ